MKTVVLAISMAVRVAVTHQAINSICTTVDQGTRLVIQGVASKRPVVARALIMAVALPITPRFTEVALQNDRPNKVCRIRPLLTSLRIKLPKPEIQAVKSEQTVSANSTRPKLQTLSRSIFMKLKPRQHNYPMRQAREAMLRKAQAAQAGIVIGPVPRIQPRNAQVRPEGATKIQQGRPCTVGATLPRTAMSTTVASTTIGLIESRTTAPRGTRQGQPAAATLTLTCMAQRHRNRPHEPTARSTWEAPTRAERLQVVALAPITLYLTPRTTI